MKKIKKWQIVEVFWVDSVSTSGWKFEDNLNDLTQSKYLLHQTIGYFCRQDKHQIVVCQSKSADGDEKSNIAEILAIPRTAIKHIKIK